MNFAEKVKLVRTELKLSQEDLARELGVSFATINRWENGSYNPSRLAKKGFEDFCEKLILLVKGNTILDGKLDDIKENYAKKNIMIKGEDIDISAIKKLKGVISVEKTRGELEVKIANKEVAPKVFNIIKNSNITKYDVVSPSLNEIFIASVGGIHE